MTILFLKQQFPRFIILWVSNGKDPTKQFQLCQHSLLECSWNLVEVKDISIMSVYTLEVFQHLNITIQVSASLLFCCGLSQLPTIGIVFHIHRNGKNNQELTFLFCGLCLCFCPCFPELLSAPLPKYLPLQALFHAASLLKVKFYEEEHTGTIKRASA